MLVPNSVWQFTDIEGICDGQYRVLSIWNELSEISLFSLGKDIGLKRPFLLALDDMLSYIREKSVRRQINMDFSGLKIREYLGSIVNIKQPLLFYARPFAFSLSSV